MWEKIDGLLARIERSEVVFIRNGTEHTGAETAAHLRRKLERTRPAVASLEEFIEKVASRSWASGKPYRVKLPDGETVETVEAAEWLRGEARKLEAEPTDP